LEGGGSGRCPRITRNLPSDTQGTMKNQDTWLHVINKFLSVQYCQ
jgi:hypothetical protein